MSAPSFHLDPADQRRLAGGLFNRVWELLEKPDRSVADDDDIVHTAHASRYHWGQVGEPVHWARGEDGLAPPAAHRGPERVSAAAGGATATASAADRLAGAGVEEVQLTGVHLDPGALALSQRALLIHPGDQRRQRGDLLRRLAVMGHRADPAVDVDLGTEFLTQPHRQFDDRGRVGLPQQARVQQVLGPDADHDVPAEVLVKRRAGRHDRCGNRQLMPPEDHPRAS